MSFEIPEYTDDLAHCDPCGWPEADTTFVAASSHPGNLERVMNPFGGRWPTFAFLKRTCLRCGFQWAEAPLPPKPVDQKPELCDVMSMGGARCVLRLGHFDNRTSPHKFGPPL